ncbi:MAG: hypothetical protein ACI89X_004753 [Planctomycetota bacterium]|jgi:hypothetical protein
MQKTILVSLLLPGVLIAQGNASFQERVDARNEAISGSLGFDFTSQYFFRGLRQENQGVIAQPWINLGINVHEGDGTLRNLNVVMGQWNSLHDGPTGSGGGGGIWTESRFYLGVEGQINERWHVGLRYNTYSSPNGTSVGIGAPIQELAISARFDDAGIVSENFSLQPTVTIAREISGQRDGGNDHGIYAQLAVSPSWVIGKLGESDLKLTLPATLGLSLGDYYENVGGGGDKFLGFLQAGGALSAPLDFMPARLGPWSGHVGLHLLLLGDSTDRRNGGDSGELIFEFGMSTQF